MLATLVLPDLLSDPAARHRANWLGAARAEQVTPPGDWLTWLLLAGRGFGKTRTAAEDVAWYGLSNPGSRIAVVAETFADGRDVCIEGESGLFGVLPEERIATWNRSLGELVLTNATRYKIYSGDKPDQLRGPQHHRAWCLSTGTPVSTKTGERPIETLVPGDVVLTSRGYRPVVATGARSAQLYTLHLADGRTLIGSADHPVATTKGFKALSELCSNDRVWAWIDDGGLTPRVTSSATKRVKSFTSTARCGRSGTALSRPVDTCTTLTRTAQTTASRIYNSLPRESIATFMRPSENTSAQSAVRHSSRRCTTAGPSIAQSADGRPESVNASWLGAPVSTAELNSKRVMAAIAVSDVSTSGRVGQVHNLTVEGQPEFFANGILTHNCDELAKFRYARETSEQLMLGLRLGEMPRLIVTTTPRPLSLLREIRDRSSTVVTAGSTFDNAANLSAVFLEQVREAYEGTRLGRQELFAEILDDVPGALWTRGMIRMIQPAAAPELDRVVVAIDPAVTSGEDADETGLVVAAKGVDGNAYVLSDRTCRLSPDGWGRRAVIAYDEYQADRIVAEVNNGGEMVEGVLRTVNPRVAYKAVHASRGKRVRAEPVAALYEQGKVFHVGAFPEMEDQMVSFVPEGNDQSPDRVDALVWALTELMLVKPQAEFFSFSFRN